ncbi:hypothetical protein F5887DRAFT_915878 [Amanita rubescens]|nr:hypothetical protein F5887DRAFT_915878 [Amanita rubescens]
MDWTSADLDAFNIVVQDQDQDTFFEGPLPDYSGFPGFIEKEEIVIPKKFRNSSFGLAFKVEHAREDMNASPIEAEWRFNEFLGQLLQFMKYQDRSHGTSTFVSEGTQIRMTVRNESAVTIVNVKVKRGSGTYPTMLILQHNKTAIKVSDPEAHLIATAIAVFQQNKKAGTRSKLEEQVILGTRTAKEIEIIAEMPELEEQVVLGITTAEQIIPTFYKIKVTTELDRAVRLGEKPATQTVVYRHKARVPKPYEDIMTLANRRRIVLYLEGFRKLLVAQCHRFPCPEYRSTATA